MIEVDAQSKLLIAALWHLYQLWEGLSQWSQSTFGTDQERGPVGPLKHLKQEIDEALESNEVEEYADCILLLFDACRRRGLTVSEMLQAAYDKLQICKTRTYPKPTTDEPGHHI